MSKQKLAELRQLDATSNTSHVAAAIFFEMLCVTAQFGAARLRPGA